MSWERRHSNEGNNEKLSNDSNDKIENHLYSKTHSNPISLENGNTLQFYVIQREKEDQVLNLKKDFMKLGHSQQAMHFQKLILVKMERLQHFTYT